MKLCVYRGFRHINVLFFLYLCFEHYLMFCNIYFKGDSAELKPNSFRTLKMFDLLFQCCDEISGVCLHPDIDYRYKKDTKPKLFSDSKISKNSWL